MKEKRPLCISLRRLPFTKICQENLQALDEAVKDAGLKYRETFKVAADLVKDGFADPMPKDLAPDWSGQHIWSLKIGAYHDDPAFGGKAGESGEFGMSNCSDIERLCFERALDISRRISTKVWRMVHGTMLPIF